MIKDNVQLIYTILCIESPIQSVASIIFQLRFSSELVVGHNAGWKPNGALTSCL